MSPDSEEKIFMNEKQLAERWDMNPGTFGVWRNKGKGPLYTKLEGKVMYELKDILAYEAAKKVDPARKNEKNAKK